MCVLRVSVSCVSCCRCEVCDYDQDDGRKTVSEQGVQRVTSKSKKETAQTEVQGPLRQTNTGAHENLTKGHRVRKTSQRRDARQVPKTHKTNTTNVCAQLLTHAVWCVSSVMWHVCAEGACACGWTTKDEAFAQRACNMHLPGQKTQQQQLLLLLQLHTQQQHTPHTHTPHTTHHTHHTHTHTTPTPHPHHTTPTPHPHHTHTTPTPHPHTTRTTHTRTRTHTPTPPHTDTLTKHAPKHHKSLVQWALCTRRFWREWYLQGQPVTDKEVGATRKRIATSFHFVFFSFNFHFAQNFSFSKHVVRRVMCNVCRIVCVMCVSCVC